MGGGSGGEGGARHGMDERGEEGHDEGVGEVGVSVEEWKRCQVDKRGRFSVGSAALVGDPRLALPPLLPSPNPAYHSPSCPLLQFPHSEPRQSPKKYLSSS